MAAHANRPPPKTRPHTSAAAGLENEWKDSRLLIKTDSNYGFASVNFKETNRQIKKYFESSPAKLHIFPGFISSDESGYTTTLGRGGSDYTAAIIAAAMDAEVLEIWTDVSGMMTADPRFVKNVRQISHITYREAMEQLDRATQFGDTSFFVRRHRAVAGERLGRLLQERKMLPEARQWVDASLALRRGLSKENPKSVQTRRDLAIALYVSCGLSLAEQQPRVALTPCSESLAIRQALLAEDGQNGALVRGMGIMHRRMGEVRAALGDTAHALTEYADAVSYYERFFGGRVGAVNDRRDLAYALLERADLAAAHGARSNVPLAQRSFREALASFDSIGTKMSLTGADSARIDQTRQRLPATAHPE